MSNYLVTFANGHSTLFASRVAAELCVTYWPDEQPTIRDLDQEARDREEMIGLLGETDESLSRLDDRLAAIDADAYTPPMLRARIKLLLKRLGRLP